MKKMLTYGSLVLLLVLGGCSSKENVQIEGNQQQNADDKLNSLKTNVEDVKVEENTIGQDVVQNKANDMNDFDGVKNIYFAFDRFNLTDKAKEKLDQNVAQFNEMDGNYNIKVEGNCDEWGTDQYNYALGLKRANEVKKYLTSKGINGDKISLVSYGESNPVCTEHHRNCWKKNRRADIKQLP
jgi:peptidoglycan-associated lipoprotein